MGQRASEVAGTNQLRDLLIQVEVTEVSPMKDVLTLSQQEGLESLRHRVQETTAELQARYDSEVRSSGVCKQYFNLYSGCCKRCYRSRRVQLEGGRW